MNLDKDKFYGIAIGKKEKPMLATGAYETSKEAKTALDSWVKKYKSKYDLKDSFTFKVLKGSEISKDVVTENNEISKDLNESTLFKTELRAFLIKE